MRSTRGPFTPADMSDEDAERGHNADIAALVTVICLKFGVGREEAEAAIEKRSL